jgi:tetratricopeptide (TPR) repeat protein
VIGEMGIGVLSGNDGYAVAREAAGKALEIDPGSTRAQAQLGRIALYEGNLEEAARQLERAMIADPTDLVVLGGAGLLLQALGRLDEALALDRFIVRRDPVNVRAIYNLATDLHWSRQFDPAIASFRTVLALSPDRSGTHATIAEALMLKGDAGAALAELEQEKSELWRDTGRVMALHDLGRKAESDSTLAAVIKAYEQEGPYNIAYVYAYRGEADKAFTVAGQGGAVRRPGALRDRDGEPVRQGPHRSALVAVPAQDRQGARATGARSSSR